MQIQVHYLQIMFPSMSINFRTDETSLLLCILVIVKKQNLTHVNDIHVCRYYYCLDSVCLCYHVFYANFVVVCALRHTVSICQLKDLANRVICIICICVFVRIGLDIEFINDLCV